MKVLMINSVCGIRSTGRICTDIAEVLDKNGHECKVAYGREKVPDKYEKYSVKIGSDFGVKIHVGLSRIFDNSGFYSKNATKKFIKWVKEYNPDIIHLHNLHGYYINLKVLFDYLKKSGKPVVWTLHDCWAFTGHAAYCDAVGCEKWKNFCSHCTQKAKYPTSKILDNSKKNYYRKKSILTKVPNLTVVTPSMWLAALVKESFIKDYAVKVINNGIDLSAFKPTPSDFRQKHNLEHRKIILGVASIWDERKGINDFIKLSELLDENYKIVLVGVSEAQKKVLPEKILTISRTDNVQQLAEIYSTADVFFNPTYEDNYPTVNLEAQACGTPVITYRTGGSVESVPEENVVDKGDLQAAYDLILADNLKINNKITSINMFAESYKNLYCEIVKIK